MNFPSSRSPCTSGTNASATIPSARTAASSSASKPASATSAIENRLGVDRVRRPGRVPFGLRAVRLGEPSRRLEAHDAVFVVQEDCAAIRAGGLDERLDRLVEELLEARRPGDRVGHAVQGVDLADALAQLFSLGDVPRGAKQVRDLALPGVERRPGGLDRDPAAPLVRSRAVIASSDSPARTSPSAAASGRLIVGMHELEEGRADDRVRVQPEQRVPGRRRVDDRPHRVHDRDQVVDALEHELLESRQVDEVVARRVAHHERIGPAHLTPRRRPTGCLSVTELAAHGKTAHRIDRLESPW